MIKLRFDPNNDCIDLIRDKHTVTCLNADEFGNLIREVKRIMEEVNPKIAKKRERKEERRQLMQRLKILIAIRLIDFINKVREFINKFTKRNNSK